PGNSSRCARRNPARRRASARHDSQPRLRASALRAYHPAKNPTAPSDDQSSEAGCDLEVDGGIDAKTAPLAVAAGANVLVAGTAIFGESEGVAPAMQRLRAAIP